MKAFSSDFMDWVAAGCMAWSEGLLSEANVFDERDLSLWQKVQQELAGSLGYACAISLPEVRRVYAERADDTIYRLDVSVGLTCNRAVCGVDIYTLAEHLFTCFAGAQYGVEENMCANVTADDLSTQSDKTRLTCTFSVSYDQPINID